MAMIAEPVSRAKNWQYTLYCCGVQARDAGEPDEAPDGISDAEARHWHDGWRDSDRDHAQAAIDFRIMKLFGDGL